MPIGIDEFEAADTIGEGTTSDRILRFLLTHADQAFTRQEIAAAIDAAPETVGTNLSRLKNRGLVRHREPYWAFTDDHEHAVDALRTRYDEARLRTLFGDEWETRIAAASSASDGASTDHGQPGRGPDADTGQAGDATVPPEPDDGPHRAAVAAFIEQVTTRVPDAVDRVYLFGSVARETPRPGSDVDILAVIAATADYATVDERLLDIAYDVQLEHEVPVEVHSMRAPEFAARRDRGDPFIQRVLTEGERYV